MFLNSISPEKVAVISTCINARVNNSVNESWSSRSSNNTSKEPTVSQITLSNIFDINSTSTWHKWEVHFCFFWSHIIAEIPVIPWNTGESPVLTIITYVFSCQKRSRHPIQMNLKPVWSWRIGIGEDYFYHEWSHQNLCRSNHQYHPGCSFQHHVELES